MFRVPFAGGTPSCPHSNCMCGIRSFLSTRRAVHSPRLCRSLKGNRVSEVKPGDMTEDLVPQFKQHRQAGLSFFALTLAWPHRSLPLPATHPLPLLGAIPSPANTKHLHQLQCHCRRSQAFSSGALITALARAQVHPHLQREQHVLTAGNSACLKLAKASPQCRVASAAHILRPAKPVPFQYFFNSQTIFYKSSPLKSLPPLLSAPLLFFHHCLNLAGALSDQGDTDGALIL